jgi:hypothetical protein
MCDGDLERVVVRPGYSRISDIFGFQQCQQGMDILKAPVRIGEETRSIADELVKSVNLVLAIVTDCSFNFWQTAELASTIETK